MGHNHNEHKKTAEEIQILDKPSIPIKQNSKNLFVRLDTLSTFRIGSWRLVPENVDCAFFFARLAELGPQEFTSQRIFGSDVPVDIFICMSTRDYIHLGKCTVIVVVPTKELLYFCSVGGCKYMHTEWEMDTTVWPRPAKPRNTDNLTLAYLIRYERETSVYLDGTEWK